MSGKRFKLETGHVITVDEGDAWMLRGRVFKGHTDGRGVTAVSCNWTRGKETQLSHMLVAQPDTYAVRFRNGNDLDFRRDNLEPMTKEEWSRWFAHSRKCATI